MTVETMHYFKAIILAISTDIDQFEMSDLKTLCFIKDYIKDRRHIDDVNQLKHYKNGCISEQLDCE